MNRLIDRHSRIADRIHHASPEELLVRAVLHHASTRGLIEAELERRARGQVPFPSRAMRRDTASEYALAA
jgi:hypothetical protein